MDAIERIAGFVKLEKTKVRHNLVGARSLEGLGTLGRLGLEIYCYTLGRLGKLMHMCQACQKLKHRASYYTTWQKSQAGQVVCLRLELATQPSREVKLPKHPVWEKLTFHIPFHPTIYIPLYLRFKESFQREFWERNPREKQDWLIHNLYLRDSSNSSTLFLSIVKFLRGSLPKPFLTVSIFVRGLFGALGSS